MKKFISALAFVAMATACGGPQDNSGGLDFTISGPGGSASNGNTLTQALTVGDPNAKSKIKSVTLTCNDMYYFGNILPVGGVIPFYYKKTRLPSGHYDCTADAFDDLFGAGIRLYSASGSVDVVDRSVAGLNLVLQEVVTPGSVSVNAPRISAISVSTTMPAIYMPVHLVATVTPGASAPEAPTYQWSVTCPESPVMDLFSMSFTAPHALVTDMTLYFCEGDAMVTLSATSHSLVEAGGSLTSTVQFVLHYVPQGIEGSVGIDSFPNIISIHSDSNMEPVAGGSVALTAVVGDPDFDLMTYAWSDDCGGSFSGGATLTPVWTAPSMKGQTCVLTLNVHEASSNPVGHTDGSNSSSITLQTSPF